MPYAEPDPTDPMTLHAIEVETENPESIREMAACFIEEFVRLGVSADRVFEMFTNGSFAGPALAHRLLGEEVISDLIAEQFALRGPRGSRVVTEQAPDGRVSLPILES